MKPLRFGFTSFVTTGLLVCVFFQGLVCAQEAYPNRVIKMVVPFPPGQLSDAMARVIAERLKDAMGQPVIVENRPGQAGSIGVASFAKAPPDGYTLLLGATAAFASNKFLYANVPYDPLKDFQPITMLSTTPLVLMVGAHVPARSLAELIKIMRDQPERLTYGSSGFGTISHTMMEAFKLAVGGGARHIPFQGNAASTMALRSGQIDIQFDGVITAQQQIQAGTFIPLAVPMLKRNPALPNIPTLAESGFSGFERTAWGAMFAPANTPKTIVDKLNREISKITSSADFRKKYEMLDLVHTTPEEAQKWIANDYNYWREVIQKANIKAE